MTKETTHPRYIINLIPTSHWDREWYRPLCEFSFFSAELYEEVIGKLESGELEHFHSDGQTAIINDLQEYRPDLYEKVCSWIQKGKIEAGPWYVLSDMLLPDGETLLRNLQFGLKDVRLAGGEASIPYAPDAFGHNADIPAILNTMGFDKYYFCRGLGNQLAEPKSEFIWKSSLGKYEILVVAGLSDLFDDEGKWISGAYALAMCLPETKAELEKRLNLIVADFKKYSNCHMIPAMCGSDHLLPQENLPEIIDTCNTQIPGILCRQNTLSGYFADFMESTDISSLPSCTGELSDGRFFLILNGTGSSRSYLKRQNRISQDMLIGQLEPWLAFAPAKQATEYSGFLEKCWRRLLQNQAHDSLCGCSTDAVHREMMVRYEQIDQLAGCMLDRIIKVICGNHTPEAFMPDENDKSFVVAIATNVCFENQNYCAFKLVHPVSIDINGYSLFLEDKEYDFFALLDDNAFSANGPFIPAGPSLVTVSSSVVYVDDLKLPAYGICLIKFSKKSGKKPSKITSLSKYPTVELDNGRLCLRTRKYFITNFLYFEDDADIGNEYFFKPVANAKTYKNTSYKLIKENHTSHLHSFELEAGINVPENFDFFITERNSKLRHISVFVNIIWHDLDERLEVKINYENKCRDHRLRAIVKLPGYINEYFLETQFGYKRNKIKNDNPVRYWAEPPNGLIRSYGWLSFPSPEDDSGITVIPKGLHEHEISSGVKLKLTLLRAVGILGGEQGGGPGILTPEAQCLGKQTAEFSIVTASFHPDKNYIKQCSDNFLHKAKGVILSGNHVGKNHWLSFFKLDSKTIVLSAIYRDYGTEYIVVRLFNPCDCPGFARICTQLKYSESHILKYQRGAILPIKRISLDKIKLQASEILTIGIK